MKRILITLCLLLSCTVPSSVYSRGVESFPVPEGLEDEVLFWKTVFGTYNSDQVILHDERFLNVIYEVIDFSGLRARERLSPAAKREIRQTEIERSRRRIAASLERLHAGAREEDLTDEEKYYRKLFAAIDDPGRFRSASIRIRAQPGQKDHLARALAKAAPWMGDIEAIFSEKNLPTELTALMFVESMFDPRAVSDVGASGLWQFMPDTGQFYVSMNDFWDNRNDALTASAGAASFLADLYRRTGDWLLAVNAYHSGVERILKGVAALGTKKIARLVEDFNEPGYGFYSRNYVPEFLAVVQLTRDREDNFGHVPEADDRRYDIVKTSDFVILPTIADRFGISTDVLRKLNTSLKEEVLTGDLPLPPYYPLKVPKGTGYPLSIAIGVR